MQNNKTHKGYYSCSKNDIQHWRYNRKKMVNGKWRYYYDDPSSKGDLPISKNSDGYVKTSKSTLGRSIKKSGFSDSLNLKNTRKKIAQAYAEGNNDNKKLYMKAYKATLDHYKDTPIGRLEIGSNKLKSVQRAISKASKKKIKK